MPPFMLAFIVAIAVYVSPAIAAPRSNATCITEHWSMNSRAQTPCLVASYLCAVCNSNESVCEADSILGTGGTVRYGIIPGTASICMCNSVLWNLVSACTLCQRELPSNWALWKETCPASMTNIGRYPAPIPAEVTVPSWAYYDFTTSGIFNPATASQLFGPESSAIPVATNTRRPAPSSTSTETSNVSRSNTGAIVGGAVGGVLGLGLIALVAFVLTRKQKHEDPATSYSEASYKPPITTQLNTGNPIVEQVSVYQLGPQLTPTSKYKPYDPNDPSTFPVTSVTPANGYDVESTPYSHQPQGAPGQQPHPNVPQV
ncbi:transmembrane protein, putative [Rhizoctonia solani AG-3 Rhs1AP]|uniref:Transmembrane protein, putative n=1 Tax=Rhizoctonia solani AG-3 Rhs1AP TaxID=1086054 RepID=X8J2R0_9AGAM|nr:transmembrane protein, putative [Rhizoctonia solani AG-3 Rhs1AP]